MARHRLPDLVEERQPDHRKMAGRNRRHQQAGYDLRHHRESGRCRARRRNWVCFIPGAWAADVLARAQRNVAAEKLREEKIASGAPVLELFSKAR
ncbi:MAG: hypothetical protein WCD52_18890 [Xanthobacteraceae bacterium]